MGLASMSAFANPCRPAFSHPVLDFLSHSGCKPPNSMPVLPGSLILRGHAGAVVEMEALPCWRWFHVDIERLVNTEAFGLRLHIGKHGLTVLELNETGTTIGRWNSRCARTFPGDQVRIGDRIVSCNEIEPTTFWSRRQMVESLKTSMDVYLMVGRFET